MNKLRLIKIYELKGKVHPIEATIIDLLDGMVNFQDNDYIIYRKDDKSYFSYNLRTNNIWLYANVTHRETEDIIKYLFEKHLNLNINRVY